MANYKFEDETKFIDGLKHRIENGALKNEDADRAFKDTLERYERLLRTTKRLVRIGDLINERQRKDAHTDILTNVDNRRAFLASLKREVDRAHRFKEPLSMLFCDIDFFKKINDQFGHDVGDTALRQFAKTVAETLRDIDLFGRLGGEEFAAILPGTDRVGAEVTAERIRQRIEAMVIELDRKDKLSFTVSIGASCLNKDGDDDQSIMARADQALYAAKNNGRNRVEFVE
jgi:diguanylate cyclase (GGDEF)-like protein